MSVLITTEPLRLRLDSNIGDTPFYFLLRTDAGGGARMGCGQDAATGLMAFVTEKRNVCLPTVENVGASLIFGNTIAKDVKFDVRNAVDMDMDNFFTYIPKSELAPLVHPCGHLVFTFWFKIDQENLPTFHRYHRKLREHEMRARSVSNEACDLCPLPANSPKNGEFTILNALPNLYDGAPFTRNDFTNFCVKVGEEEFWVQKSIVAAQSKKFRGMFTTEMIEKKTGVSTIRDEKTTPEKMRHFMDMLYDRKTINDHWTDSDWLTGVYEVAHEYEADGVKSLVEDAFNITSISTSTFLQILGVAQLYSLDFLFDRCAAAAKQLGPEFWDQAEVKKNAKDGYTKAVVSLVQRLVQ